MKRLDVVVPSLGFGSPTPPSASTLSLMALFLLSLFACSDSTGPGDDGGPSEEVILFVSDEGGSVGLAGDPLFDIFAVRGDGSERWNVTDAPAQVYREMSLSPDGSTLVFESDREGCYNVWTMNPDGTDPVLLTDGVADRCNEMPRWSGDGSRIAFTTSRETIDRSWEVYVMNADGSNPHNVSDNGGDEGSGWDFPLGWSPEGEVIFGHLGSGPWEVFSVHPDGGALKPVPSLTGGYAPFWSPDGGRVAFMTGDVGAEGIVIMNSDGTARTNISSAQGADSFNPGYRVSSYRNPWSPDGSRLAFVSSRDGNREVYVMSASGGVAINVSNDPGEDRFDGWSPDGSQLVFSSQRDGDWDVFVVNVDGTELRNLTNSPADEFGGLWLEGGLQ